MSGDALCFLPLPLSSHWQSPALTLHPAWYLLPRLSDEIGNGTNEVVILVCKECYGCADMGPPACSADAVDIVCRRAGAVKIDDRLDVDKVYSTSQYVCGYEDVFLT